MRCGMNWVDVFVAMQNGSNAKPNANHLPAPALELPLVLAPPVVPRPPRSRPPAAAAAVELVFVFEGTGLVLSPVVVMW